MTQTTFDWLQRSFLRFIQTENECRADGVPCRADDKCGCQLEMENWINETAH